ncbi:MAG: C25 family peptidase propeptide domain-containing protein, partial [Lentisphaeria bacterium]|nr:C25 family peptidase propeptide domain-containing protein [Lentisphaeria bacterium]
MLVAVRLWLADGSVPGRDSRGDAQGQGVPSVAGRPFLRPHTTPPPSASRMSGNAPAPGASTTPPPTATPPETPTFAILASTPRETLAEIRFPEPALTPVEHQGRQAVRVSMAGCQDLKGVNEPALPVRRWDLALPADALARIEIVSLDSYTVPSDPPVPSGGFGLRTQPRPVGGFGPAYDGSESYPAEIARLSPTYRIRQIEGAGVIVHPVRYLPAAASIEVVRSIQVRIQHEPRTPTTTLRYPAPPNSRSFRALAAARFENYSASIADETDTTTVRTDGSFTGTDKLLVILPDAWDLALFDEFLAWKRQRGLSILTARYPTDTGSGTAALASYIRSAYDNEDIAYVILLGDEYAIPNGTGSLAPSDTIYTLVAGSDDYH